MTMEDVKVAMLWDQEALSELDAEYQQAGKVCGRLLDEMEYHKNRIVVFRKLRELEDTHDRNCRFEISQDNVSIEKDAK